MGSMCIKKIVLSICSTNCYIVYNAESREGIIIDPADNPRIIDSYIREQQIGIRGIFLTHGHFDHIGAAEELKKLYGVKVYAHEEETELAGDTILNLSAAFDTDDSVKVDVPVKDGETVEMCGFKIKVIHTPGHTKGSCCYLMDDGSDVRLFSGDTLFCQSHGRTDFPTGSERQIYASITEKLLVLDGGLTVYPGHGESTTIDDEKKWYWR